MVRVVSVPGATALLVTFNDGCSLAKAPDTLRFFAGPSAKGLRDGSSSRGAQHTLTGGPSAACWKKSVLVRGETIAWRFDLDPSGAQPERKGISH